MREHVHEHAHVRLHFSKSRAGRARSTTINHAALAWQHPGAFDVAPMLPCQWPDSQVPAPAANDGHYRKRIAGDGCSAGGDRNRDRHRLPAHPGARKAMSPAQLADFVARCGLRAEQSGTLVIVNASPERARQTSADGVHLDTATLLRSASRPAFEWVGASCHNRAELEKAASLELDYALLGPVGETASHPGQPGIGWQAFETLASGLPIPVLALGGLSPARCTTPADMAPTALPRSAVCGARVEPSRSVLEFARIGLRARHLVLVRGPGTEIYLAAALAAERPPSVVGRPFARLAAIRALDDSSWHRIVSGHCQRLQKVSSKFTSAWFAADATRSREA